MARDPYQYFRIEARELLDELARGTMQLEKSAEPEITAGILRAAHTLKGAARVVKQPQIAEHAHAIEEELAGLRDARGTVERARIERLLKLIDAISHGLRSLDPSPVAAAHGHGATSPAPTVGPVAQEESVRFVRAEAGELDSLVDSLGEVAQQLRTFRQAVSDVSRARQLAQSLEDRLGPAAAVGAGNREPGVARLRSLVEELRDATSGAEQRLTGALDQAERDLRETRNAADRLRLVPASVLFVTLERTAHDVALSLGKETALEARGGDIRLEAQVLTAIQPALVQLIRNAVAHGIEGAAERRQAGKPTAGHVQIEALRRGNQVAFVCRDDGKGIDLPAVERAARQKGLLPDGPSAPPDELFRLLLRGGLTTSRAVSEVSGRGIGLDVVRNVAAQLRGEVAVTTAPGAGTTFELRVPLSLASFDALLVEVEGVSAAIPLDSVRRTVRLTDGDLTRSAGGPSIVHEGRVIPFVPMTRALGRRTAVKQTGACSAVVVGAAAGPTAGLAAFSVDRLLGTANVVARALPALAHADPVVAGATLDAEGTPRLVLDPSALVEQAARALPDDAPVENHPPPPMLVIDDSLTTRMLEQSILESAGYEVDVARSGEEGMEKARQRRYALFLVDVEMPGMDGFSFVANTRADPMLRDTPAILVTSRDAPEDRARGVEAGAAGHVVKGEFDQSELLALIRRLVR